MEPQLDLSDLGIAFSKLAEALMIEHNVPCTRCYTHAELEDSFRAIRESAEKLKEPLEITEEHRKEAAEDMERAYPERRPR